MNNCMLAYVPNKYKYADSNYGIVGTIYGGSYDRRIYSFVRRHQGLMQQFLDEDAAGLRQGAPQLWLRDEGMLA
jgi:hypothetical protein